MLRGCAAMMRGDDPAAPLTRQTRVTRRVAATAGGGDKKDWRGETAGTRGRRSPQTTTAILSTTVRSRAMRRCNARSSTRSRTMRTQEEGGGGAGEGVRATVYPPSSLAVSQHPCKVVSRSRARCPVLAYAAAVVVPRCLPRPASQGALASSSHIKRATTSRVANPGQKCANVPNGTGAARLPSVLLPASAAEAEQAYISSRAAGRTAGKARFQGLLPRQDVVMPTNNHQTHLPLAAACQNLPCLGLGKQHHVSGPCSPGQPSRRRCAFSTDEQAQTQPHAYRAQAPAMYPLRERASVAVRL